MKTAQVGKDIEKAAEMLRNGGLVGIPTETVYGLAANALDEKAVTQIFKVKNRPSFDPLIIHVASLADFQLYVKEIPVNLLKLAEKTGPGPLTLLLPKKDIIPDIVTSGLERVAIRIPNHPLTLELLRQLDFPLAAPSANPFGYISPTRPEHVVAQLGNQLDYVIDGGASEVGIESTIIGIEGDKTIIYRKGGLSIEQIEKEIGKVYVLDHSTSNPEAPGMLKSHYAPNKKVMVYSTNMHFEMINPAKTGFLGFRYNIVGVPAENQFILSHEGDYSEAARKLFYGLRWLDGLDIDTILIELLPEENLGRAINDRLRRAAAMD
jgi:L-threonylcarbamoyladenylate synthase